MENVIKNIGKKVSKNVSEKYSQKNLDLAKQSAADGFKNNFQKK